MKTLTVKVPEKLDLKLAILAAKRGETKSDLIRTAINSILEENEAVVANSCLDMATDLVGSVEGPSDLSFNKKHLKGYGK
jgi:predicted DNA-binding protein